MKKKVSLIECDYGKVYVKAIQNMRRDKVIEIAKGYFEEKLGKELNELPNVRYYRQNEWKIKQHDDIVFRGEKEYWDGIDLVEI